MSDAKTIHVSPNGETWEVESDVGTLGQAETKEEAIEVAREAAAEQHAASVVIHTSDGMVEKEIPISAPVGRRPAAGGETAD